MSYQSSLRRSRIEGSDSDEENQKRFSFLPEETQKAYKKAEVWEELGRLLDETGGKDFRTDMRDGVLFLYFHELVLPHQEGEAEKKIVPIRSERNKRIDSILFLAICAGLYWIYLHTDSWLITALAIIVFSVIRRTLFYSIIKLLVAKRRLNS